MPEGHTHLEDSGGASPPPSSTGVDELRRGGGGGVPKSQDESHRPERVSSRSSYREREREREKDRDRVRHGDRNGHRDGDRDRSHRAIEMIRESSNRRDRGRGRDGHEHRRSRDYDRHDRKHDEWGGHRPQSQTGGRSERRSRSRSPSKSKTKRISGFDMTPLQSAALTDVEVPGQVPGAPATISYPLAVAQPMTQMATRHARRVYVGGLSPTANEQSVATFFSQVMAAIGGNTYGPGDAVINVFISYEKKFAFVEMRSVEEASNAMTLDGIIFEGAPVKVRRPSDYNPCIAAALGPSQPNPNLNLAAVGLSSRSAIGIEGPDRIFVGGLPFYVMEEQIRELLESFGPLRGFVLVKDRETGNPKGYAFCIYQDQSVTDIACAALNGIKMGDKTLTVRRANQGTALPRPEQESVLLQAQQQVDYQRFVFQGGAASKVVCLTNVVTAEELKENVAYEDIMEDMRVEAGKYGKVVTVVIPRPGLSGETAPGVGKVFLEYADIDGSMKARQSMHGRKFGGNQVTALYFSENKFAGGEYD